MCFFNSAEYACLEQRQPVSTLKNLSCRKYSFQKLTQLSQGNNVLDAPAYDTNDFLGEIRLFCQLSWICLFWTKKACLHLKKPKLQEVFLPKLTQFSQGNNVLVTPASKKDGFPSKDMCVSSTFLNTPLWKKWALLHLENMICTKYSSEKLIQF
jgi:hypothetical protein